MLKAHMKTTTTKELEEKERARLKKDNKLLCVEDIATMPTKLCQSGIQMNT